MQGKKSKYGMAGGKKTKYGMAGGKNTKYMMAGGKKTPKVEMYKDYVQRMFGGRSTKGSAMGGPGLKKKR